MAPLRADRARAVPEPLRDRRAPSWPARASRTAVVRQRRQHAPGSSRSCGSSSGRRADHGEHAREPVPGADELLLRCRRAAASRSAARARPSGAVQVLRERAPRRCSSAARPCAQSSRRRPPAGPGCPTAARACRHAGAATASSASRAGERRRRCVSRHATSAIPPSPSHRLGTGPPNSGRRP